MALESLWALLNGEVSEVSKVQTCIHAGLRDTPSFLPEVSRVSSNDLNGPWTSDASSIDTPDTPPENVRYQPQPAWILGCTLDTPDTPEKINNEVHPANEMLSGDQFTTEHKRLFKEHWLGLTDTEQSAALMYHTHHFNCNTCIAAGRGNRYGNRCNVGLTLWSNYQGTDQFTG
jgi:hypothetical protein